MECLIRAGPPLLPLLLHVSMSLNPWHPDHPILSLLLFDSGVALKQRIFVFMSCKLQSIPINSEVYKQLHKTHTVESTYDKEAGTTNNTSLPQTCVWKEPNKGMSKLRKS